MLRPLPTPQEMAIWDRETIDTFGIPGVVLMENASRAALSVLLEEFGSVTQAAILCIAGPGNNGGDTFALARHLVDLGANVTVFHTKPEERYQNESLAHLQWAKQAGVSIELLQDPSRLLQLRPDILIDGLLGTGLTKQLRPETLLTIQHMNTLGHSSFVFSIDIPSGINGVTGFPSPDAIIANTTVTFEAPKLGLVLPHTSRYIGTLHTKSIGIPQVIRSKHPAAQSLITTRILDEITPLPIDMHKGMGGHILIAGGSEGMTGAPVLAAKGAFRSGAGLVTLACPSEIAAVIQAGNPDIMTLPLGNGSHWSTRESQQLLEKATNYDVIVLGPGLGRSRKTVDFLRTFIAECPTRLVLDADALYCLAQIPATEVSLPPQTIMTPHPGEMATLLGIKTKDIQKRRLLTAQKFVQLYDTTVVLKGAGTIVANKEKTCLSPFAEANLAVAGSGDVLSGVIGTLLAQGHTALNAACLGVYWHGLAGKALQETFPARGNMASEIADMLPRVVQKRYEDRSC